MRQKGFIKGAGILYENSQVVVIATGANGSRKSRNVKTGHMAQIWILVKAVDPVTAVKTGLDKAVCFNCPYRGDEGLDRACYVTTYDLARAPGSIWKAYRRNRYEHITTSGQIAKLFGDAAVRFGAYGEPVLIPLPTIKAITEVAKTWTGYTHQWKRVKYLAYRRYLMASTSETDYQQAQSLGWRTFSVSATTLQGQIVCPASAERGHKLSCEECGLCAGTTRVARSVQIAPHGSGAKYAAAA
jgi:hypothetical protein